MRAIVTGRPDVASHQAWLEAGTVRIAAAVGPRGIILHKQEGDSGTPAGTFPIRKVLYRADRIAPPACAVPREPIAHDDGWCDAPGDPLYNRQVRLPYGASAERLWRDDALYDLVAVLGFNDAPVMPGAGSAIFLHPWKGGRPTKGCVAVALDDLRRLLAAGLTEIELLAS